MKELIASAFLGLISMASTGQDWCPKGKEVIVSPSVKMTVEGIVDYEDENFCRILINQGTVKTILMFTEKGDYYRIIQYEYGKKRTELDIKGRKAVLKIFDQKGEVVEELRSREAF
ncbi:hypothetical protein [Aquifex sp.]